MTDWYRLAGPAVRALEPETAHRLTLWLLRLGLAPIRPPVLDPILAQTLWGRRFASPVGLAAGFDKDGEAVDALVGLGFGFVEIGSVTLRPQPGNPPPRLFRLVEDEAVINRMGVNNRGVAALRARLQARHARPLAPLGINLGLNRDAEDAAADYAESAAALAPFADYLVVNVSSPNTPGLRDLQGPDRLGPILHRIRTRLAESGEVAPPLLVKVAPDLGAGHCRAIIDTALAEGAQGLIVSNTTTARPPGLKSPYRAETGGLSGRPLFGPSTVMLTEMRRLTRGRIPLIGVGGIASADDAYAKIRAGASLIQLYTALVYQGPGLIQRICEGLVQRLKADGFASIAEAVGADVPD